MILTTNLVSLEVIYAFITKTLNPRKGCQFFTSATNYGAIMEIFLSVWCGTSSPTQSRHWILKFYSFWKFKNFKLSMSLNLNCVFWNFDQLLQKSWILIFCTYKLILDAHFLYKFWKCDLYTWSNLDAFSMKFLIFFPSKFI